MTQRVADEVAKPEHFYGGQAVVEGVMMRGRDVWAVAIRRPAGDIHVESHEIDSVAKRHPILRKPFLRGVIALGQALAIGFRALSISARESAPEDEQLTSRQMAVSFVIAAVIFIGLFIVLPAATFGWVGRMIGSSILTNVLEGLFRVGLFLGYLLVIGRAKDIRRVFAYHGAEHKTIAAYEHDDPLTPDRIGPYSTLHVRCGTNFLLIVMVTTISGLAFELLRLGARYPRSALMRIVMTPGLWLQKITTKPPDDGQIEVAIASFNEVLKREQQARSAEA
jgi:uncharacterized protein YqhQ